MLLLVLCVAAFVLLFFGGFTRQFTGSSKLAKNTHLMWLSGEGDVAGVQRLLESGSRVDAQNFIGGEALMAAALNGRAETVRFLLGKGADANAQTAGYGGSAMYTALMLAAKNGDLETARLLVGAALQRAASAQMLLPRISEGAESGALEGLLQLSQAELMQKAMKGDRNASLLMMAAGARKDIDGLDKANRHGRTALMEAIVHGRTDMARVLLEAGAKTRVVDVFGMTPLHLAAQGGHAGIVRLLLEHGADVNAKHSDGVTALALAQATGRADIVQMLREAEQKAEKEAEAAEAVVGVASAASAAGAASAASAAAKPETKAQKSAGASAKPKAKAKK